MDVPLAELVGTVAGLCSTGSFIPQVVKAWRGHDTAAISKRMYVITVTVAFNTASLLLSSTILVLKVRGTRAAAGG